jgi:hypothetical protein
MRDYPSASQVAATSSMIELISAQTMQSNQEAYAELGRKASSLLASVANTLQKADAARIPNISANLESLIRYVFRSKSRQTHVESDLAGSLRKYASRSTHALRLSTKSPSFSSLPNDLSRQRRRQMPSAGSRRRFKTSWSSFKCV